MRPAVNKIMIRLALLVISSITVLLLIPSAGRAGVFDCDDSGGLKMSISSFFDERPAKDEDDRESRYKAAENIDDKDYTVDTLGRKVPVRTKRGGSAIETR